FPAAGSRTLEFGSTSIVEGHQRSLIYYSGVDQSSPIVDADTHTGSDDGTSFTSSLTRVTADDMGAVVAYNFSTAPAVPGCSQPTVLTPGVFNNAGMGIGEEQGEDEMVASAADLVAVAFALRAATEDPEPDPEEVELYESALAATESVSASTRVSATASESALAATESVSASTRVSATASESALAATEAATARTRLRAAAGDSGPAATEPATASAAASAAATDRAPAARAS